MSWMRPGLGSWTPVGLLAGELESFEKEYAAYCGAKHCIGVGSGVDALHLALRAWEIGLGDEVSRPRTRSSPLGSLSPWRGLHQFRSNRTRRCSISIQGALPPPSLRAPVYYPGTFDGQPADMKPINAIAEKHGLKVLEDAAQAQGALYKGRRVGSLGTPPRTASIRAKTLAPSVMGSDNY